jgi:hypothetical protein
MSGSSSSFPKVVFPNCIISLGLITHREQFDIFLEFYAGAITNCSFPFLDRFLGPLMWMERKTITNQYNLFIYRIICPDIRRL